MIQVTGLRKTYVMGDSVVEALKDVTLTIESGEFVAIMGPSGSGKSTLMHVLGLLDVPDAGSYKLLGREAARLDEDALADLRGRAIGFVFQQFNLLPRATALENTALPLLYSGNGRDPARPGQLLADVGLGERSGHKPNQLSGGQQQRVAIARALVNDPAILFADEPTGNLDSASEKEIMGIFTKLNRERGITVVLVTHEPEIGEYADRVIRMRDGRVQSDERKPSAPAPGAGPRRTEKALRGSTSGLRALVKESGDHFLQAFASLTGNKVRSGLSMLGILIGVAAVIAMLALGTGARQSIETQLASLGSNLLTLRPGARRAGGVALESGAVTRITLEDAKDIADEIPSVKRTAPSVNGRAQVTYGNKNWNTQVLGTTAEYAAMRAAQPVVGRFFTEEEDRKRSRVVVLGLTVARNLFGDASPMGEIVKINKVSFQVIGLLPEKGANAFRDQDDQLAIPLNTAMRRLLGKDYVDSVDIEVADPSLMEEAQNAVKALVSRRHRLPPSRQDAFDIRNMADIQSALSETSRTMSMLLASIAAISLVVGGIGIMNIMLVSVTERTKEIGLRKAVGARRRDILAQFLIEAVVVSLTGGVLGVALGWSAAFTMSHLAGWAASVSLSSVLLATVFSATVGVVFGLWPARKASLLAPINALRYE